MPLQHFNYINTSVKFFLKTKCYKISANVFIRLGSCIFSSFLFSAVAFYLHTVLGICQLKIKKEKRVQYIQNIKDELILHEWKVLKVKEVLFLSLQIFIKVTADGEAANNATTPGKYHHWYSPWPFAGIEFLTLCPVSHLFLLGC